MAQIVNNDKLIFIITAKGLQRITDVAEGRADSINITNVRVGDANGEYYVPSDADEQINLRNPIRGGVFPVLEKSLLDDNLTVSFRFIIPETFDNCDIREIGLYMDVDGQEIPFAIGVQQPLVKPSILDDYFISVDYYIYLRSENLAEEYDKIYLDPENQLATDTDIEELVRTILWSQTNLMEQVGSNSKIIGLDRAAQLQELIESNKINVSNAISYGNYTNLLQYTNEENIFSYWVFNQSKINTLGASIPDFGPDGINLSTNTSLETFGMKYLGITPSLKIDSDHYFYLDRDHPLSLLNEDGTSDIDFTIAFVVEPLPDYANTGRIILAKFNAATSNQVFTVWETTGNRLALALYSDPSNYLYFSSVELAVPKTAHSVVITYDHAEQRAKAFINGFEVTLDKTEHGTYTHMSNVLSTLYAFLANPVYKVYTDSPTEPTELYGLDGAPNLDPNYVILDNKVYHGSTECTYVSADNMVRPTLHAYAYGSNYIYIKDDTVSETTILYNADYTVNTSDDYRIIEVSGAYVIQFSGYTMRRAQYYDIESSTVYAWEYTGSSLIIWANKPSNPTILYDSSGNVYKGANWTISNGKVMYNNQYTAVYTPAYNRQLPPLETTSYITNGNGEKINFTNSYMGILGVIKTKLTDDQAKTLGITLASAAGVNPCIIVSG